MRLNKLDYIPFLSTFNSVIRLLDVLTGKAHAFAVRSLYNGEEPSKAARLGRAAITAIPGLNLLTIPYDFFRSHQSNSQPVEIEMKSLSELLGCKAPSPEIDPELFEKGSHTPIQNEIIVSFHKNTYVYGEVIAVFMGLQLPTALISFGSGTPLVKVELNVSPPTDPVQSPVGPLYKLKTFD